MDNHNISTNSNNNHHSTNCVSHRDNRGGVAGGDRRSFTSHHFHKKINDNVVNDDHRRRRRRQGDDDDDSRDRRSGSHSRRRRHHHHHRRRESSSPQSRRHGGDDRSRSRERRSSISDNYYYENDSIDHPKSVHHHKRMYDYSYCDGDDRHNNKNDNDCHPRNHHSNHRHDDDGKDRHYLVGPPHSPPEHDRQKVSQQKQEQPQQHGKRCILPHYEVVKAPSDERLGVVQNDPRGCDPTQRLTKKASTRGNGRNTESFDPATTLVRPDVRVWVGSNTIDQYNRVLKHDDVVIVPELFGGEDDWSLYYQLVQEVTAIQKDPIHNKGSEWISWHEGAHLIAKNVNGSATYKTIVDRMCEYFNIDKNSNIGTRFNWYRDSSDWKPFHHDSAAFNPQRAKNQNITVGASFGATRELAFIRTEEYRNGDKCRLYFPQVNNGVFSFGRDTNILWKHGVTALPPPEQDGKGRISIILWGLARDAIDEEGSPPLLGSDGMGPHASAPHHHQRQHGRGMAFIADRGIGSNDGGGSGRGRGDDHQSRRGSHRHHNNSQQDRNSKNTSNNGQTKTDPPSKKNSHPPKDQENLPPNRE
jgi:hypothetical protein